MPPNCTCWCHKIWSESPFPCLSFLSSLCILILGICLDYSFLSFCTSGWLFYFLFHYLYEQLCQLLWMLHSIYYSLLQGQKITPKFEQMSERLTVFIGSLKQCYWPQYFFLLIIYESIAISNTTFRLCGRQTEPFSWKTLRALSRFLSFLGFSYALWKLLFSSVQPRCRTCLYTALHSP